MSELIEFLNAQIDEDERIAAEAIDPPWSVQGPDDERWIRSDPDWLTVGAHVDEDTGQHIARHDPARVLREVVAKRLIIAEHQQIPSDREDLPDGWPTTGCRVCNTSSDGWTDPGGDCYTVKSLAQPYADRPGWKEEWRVG